MFPVCIVANCSLSCVHCVIVLCVLLLPRVYCCTVLCVYYNLDTLVAGLLASSPVYPEGPATSQLGTDFSWFSPVSVYKRILRWFPILQVATARFTCSPPYLNFVVTYFIFTYMRNNHCHRVTAKLQLINIIIIIIIIKQTRDI
jgi:hypothetical protein